MRSMAARKIAASTCSIAAMRKRCQCANWWPNGWIDIWSKLNSYQMASGACERPRFDERSYPMMKLARVLLAIALLALLVGIARVAQENEPAGAKMVRAAETFVSSLTAEQQAKALFEFDDKERFNWHFVPLQDQQKRSTRKGLPLADMKPEQRQAALDLIK